MNRITAVDGERVSIDRTHKTESIIEYRDKLAIICSFCWCIILE